MSRNNKILNIVESYFKKKNTNKEVFFNLALLLFKNESGEKSLRSIPDIIGVPAFIKLINYTDGKMIKTPTKEELRQYLLVILFYYMRHIEGKQWVDIVKEIDYSAFGVAQEKLQIIRKKVSELDSSIKESLAHVANSKELLAYMSELLEK